MPLTSKGEEILANMQKQYGDKKGEEVFYASKNKGTITGVDSAPDRRLDMLDKAADALADLSKEGRRLRERTDILIGGR